MGARSLYSLMRPDGRQLRAMHRALCSPVVLHMFRQSQKAIIHSISLPCCKSTVKKDKMPFDIFYFLATNTLGFAVVFV